MWVWFWGRVPFSAALSSISFTAWPIPLTSSSISLTPFQRKEKEKFAYSTWQLYSLASSSFSFLHREKFILLILRHFYPHSACPPCFCWPHCSTLYFTLFLHFTAFLNPIAVLSFRLPSHFFAFLLDWRVWPVMMLTLKPFQLSRFCKTKRGHIFVWMRFSNANHQNQCR